MAQTIAMTSCLVCEYRHLTDESDLLTYATILWSCFPGASVLGSQIDSYDGDASVTSSVSLV